MFVQWCVKGIRADSAGKTGLTDAQALYILSSGEGICCNLWRNSPGATRPLNIETELTAFNLDQHIHNYGSFGARTPFISLSAGSVERNAALSVNRIYEAREVALRFATNWGSHDGFLFFCWVIVGLKPAAAIQMVSEEVRDLNSFTRYSDFQLEGEVTAKINVPSNQIHRFEKWCPGGDGKFDALPSAIHPNPGFETPAQLSNIIDML
ncbi:hypothetical protein [Variovorax fucosicus]|uniref:hypothetical protein n=1 Tax=Variovorax fucosicus TaxID=3053517 RepID=UPI002577DF2A|nr:hypothetical protein [Variovorax sp. J22G47]MDM0059012.1 hypothetical protein [Variovorax sp. J22G47]